MRDHEAAFAWLFDSAPHQIQATTRYDCDLPVCWWDVKAIVHRLLLMYRSAIYTPVAYERATFFYLTMCIANNLPIYLNSFPYKFLNSPFSYFKTHQKTNPKVFPDYPR